MSEQHLLPDDPREWLNRAKSNLARSRVVMEEIYLEDLCFDAEQAAEKAIKQEEYVEGVSIAEAVVRWADEVIGDSPPPTAEMDSAEKFEE